MLYFCNFCENIVSNLRPTTDYYLISAEYAQNLIDEQDGSGQWVFWNSSDLVRTCEKPFDIENFKKVFDKCTWVFFASDNTILDRDFLRKNLSYIESVQYRYDKESRYLFVSKLVFK
jgi:hypothetical protein